MVHRYSLIPSATYIPRTPNEVLVKGGALEGFSLIIDDPSRRGLAVQIVDELQRAPQSITELSSVLQARVELDDLETMLESLESGGAIMRLDEESLPQVEEAWATFIRYGYIPSKSLLSELTVVGEGDVDQYLRVAKSWGIPFCVVSPRELEFEHLQNTFEHSRSLPEVEDLEKSASDRDVLTEAKAHSRELGVVFIGESSERKELMSFNREAVRRGISVLYAGIDGADYSVGPYVVPGKTACMWETERQWARASADREQYESLLRSRERIKLSATEADSGDSPHVATDMFSATIAPALLELSLRRTSGRGGVVLHGRSTTSDLRDHSVMRLPRCPVCAPMQPIARNPLY